MKKHIVFFLFLITQNLNAQTFLKYWDKCFGGDKSEGYGRTSLMPTGLLIFSGTSISQITGNKTETICPNGPFNGAGDVWIVKTDINGNILWDKDFGGGSAVNAGVEIVGNTIVFNDGKLLFTSYSDSDSSCEKSDTCRGDTDYWIGLVDSTGTLLWNKTYGGTGGEGNEYTTAAQMNNGNILICGASRSGMGGDKTVPNLGTGFSTNDVWLVMLDSAGNKLWDKGYGSAGEEEPFAVIKDNSENFVLVCSVIGPAGDDVTDSSRGATDLWLLKIDSTGNKLWDKRYGGSYIDIMYDIQQTSDSGYIIAGNTYSPQGLDVSEAKKGMSDVWILKTDANGNKQWDKRYGGNNLSGTFGKRIIHDYDTGYLIAGSTNSDSTNDVSEQNYGVGLVPDFWIFKIDSAGNKIWDKRYGGADSDYAYGLTLLPDTSIVAVGEANPGISIAKTDSGYGQTDYWAVRFKYIDNSVGISPTPALAEGEGIFIRPNPAEDIITITCKGLDKGTIIIYDQMGKVVYTKENTLLNTRFDISSLAKGVYFLIVKGDRFNEVVKVVKM